MNVLVTGNLPEKVLSLLGEMHAVEFHTEDRPLERSRFVEMVGDKEGLLCMITDRIDDDLLQHAPRLRVIANMAVGYDNIDIEAASKRGIPVSNTPGVLTDATADLAFALMLAVARRLVEGDLMTREGGFRFWAPMYFLGHEVSGKTLGIVGLGRIGKAVARRARGFEMEVLYHSRTRMAPEQERELELSYRDMESLLSRADFVSLHVPLTPDTHHLIGEKELAMMRESAYLINTSRGPVVDEKALVRALEKRTIAGAGLDVYEEEPALTPGLKELNNVVLLPHMGSATVETRSRMALRAAENLLAGLVGKRPADCLNWDDIHGNSDRRA
ncbi:MAG: D-glycerate dehydrogenase [Deltaproteobacteria bacterium]|nr:MAG: D-glycerate dehydrogenase [Deltaproteobacteria bacterium]